MTYLHSIGEYFIMLKGVFGRMTKGSVLRNLIFKEINELIMGSLGIVAFLSFFIGAVVAIQTALNLNNPLIPKSLVAFAARQSVILEFAPTFISIIMAGKVGSFITSSIGSMRVTEQIDALEVMGINSKNYLILPKIIAMLTYPFLIAIAMFLGIAGAYFAAVFGGFVTSDQFLTGLQDDFNGFHLTYAFIKTFLFAFILATVPSYHGYYMKGGALEVGEASTTSFVWTSVVLIITNYAITQLLLS
ncbi:MlaE family ABC transporter permease [Christiangramia forsetii]|uniref:ABC-type transporter permease protein n=2 Tax=Christiangramia forsetii TaxID=411153 RepID=A0M5E0_CHRFK|nr:ABC transporter permease [Christiangramia forsetii]GGG21161.1 ABC transporter permease [Christiangramia forsetii]CAL67835.1 ABC-type transporter permease protein [Christiangramia forsetii KT0803]